MVVPKTKEDKIMKKNSLITKVTAGVLALALAAAFIMFSPSASCHAKVRPSNNQMSVSRVNPIPPILGKP